MLIRKLYRDEALPVDLLLLADPSEKLVREYARRGQCFVMTIDESIIGAYILLETRPETIEIVNVAVKEVYQGQGYGKALIRHAIQTVKNEGYKTVEIGTGNSSVSQLILYQKCGFRITWVDRDFFLRHYDEPIFENDIQVVDMIRLAQDL